MGEANQPTSLSVLRDLTITPSHLVGNLTGDDYLEYTQLP